MYDFTVIWDLRNKANKILEPYRAKKIKPIDLHLHITVAPDDPLVAFTNYADQLNDIFGVSKFTFSTEDFLLEPQFTIVDAEGIKCARCLKWFDDYLSPVRPELCFRCDRVINMMSYDAMIILFKRVIIYLHEVAYGE